MAGDQGGVDVQDQTWQFASAAARRASGVYAAGINDAQSTVLRRVARLLFALGRKAEGSDALAESVHALLTWPGPSVPWLDVAERIELARHELTGDPALATVRNTLAAVLTRHETIPETASAGVPKAFRALRAIGAKTEARHLARLYEGDVESA